MFSISLFLVVLDLLCCVWTFSSCGEQGLLSSCGAQASYCSGFSIAKHRLLVSALQQSWPTGLVALQHVGSCQTRDQTSVL